MAEESLVAIVMPGRIEFKGALTHELRLQLRFEFGVFRFQINADTRQNARQGFDIRLRVTGADAHGVQFHDLAGVVLVQMPRRVVSVIEITQHRRVMQGGGQQIAEFSERIWPDCPVLVVTDQDADVRLVLMDVEMVEPEPGHLFTQLVGRIKVAQDLARWMLRDAACLARSFMAC